ncbi:MAG: anti-phage defense ZorAB system ZorA [Alteromonadaceae bacterium]|nr:anti-phage defense ZorAB system ZorA [Alteromonadaceae bacterium]
MSSPMENVSLAWLIPDFSQGIFSLKNTVSISNSFIVILVIIFVFAAIYFVINYFNASARMSWLSKLVDGVTRENVIEKRAELKEKAMSRIQKDKIMGHLWLEFDETLVMVSHNNAKELRNTFDFGHFFNAHSVARNVTENRLVAAVPAFLTAIGVIGTFVGLQIGLTELNLSGDVDELKNGIAGVVNGAKIAFVTSICGIALSVLFNFFEKLLEQRIYAKLSKIEAAVDWIFPRIRPEEQLHEIAEHTQQSRESLQGLAEKIGTELQKSMVTATDSIRQGLEDSLNSIMAPAINKLVQQTSDGNQQALESLLDNFMEKFGERGESQRNLMENASERMNASIDSMNSSLASFISQMQSQQQAAVEREQAFSQGFDSKLNGMLGSIQQAMEQNHASTNSFVENIKSQINAQQEEAKKREEAFSEGFETKLSSLLEHLDAAADKNNASTNAFVENLQKQLQAQEQASLGHANELRNIINSQSTNMQSTVDAIMDSVKQGVQGIQSELDQIIEQNKDLQATFTTAIATNAKASEGMAKSATSLEVAASRIDDFATRMDKTSETLVGSIDAFVEKSDAMTTFNQQTFENVKAKHEMLLLEVEKFEGISSKIDGLFGQANQVFSKLSEEQQAFLRSQKQHIDELTAQMQQHMQAYAQKTNENVKLQMDEWGKSTQEFSNKLTQAFNTMQSILDDMQGE